MSILICPKCKTKVSKDDTVCPNCNLRLIFKCPRCGAPTHLGSVSCQNCDYTFVKFCPKCKSANYVTSSACRKCGHEFSVDDLKNNSNSNKKETASKSSVIQNQDGEKIAAKSELKTQSKETEKQKEEPKSQGASDEDEQIKPDKNENPLIVCIDFTNLDGVFEKYDKNEFKQKVIENIKTTVKIAFGTSFEMVNSHTIEFKYYRSKTVKILDKINQFETEFKKFNKILEKTLNTGLTYKFAILTVGEFRKTLGKTQLNLASDKDVIVSSGAYVKLNSELSLIKISSDSYKMIFLDQKPVFEQAEDEKYDKALEIILNNLADNNSQVRAISVNAQRGVGKTHLLEDLYSKINKLKTQNTLVFYAQCSALTQVGLYGLIQNFFISFFDCPSFLREDFNIKLFEKRVLEKLNLEKIEPENLETLANLIYPLKKDYFENILINKEITYKYLKDVFEYVKKIKNVIFIIDDFDLVDESSYGFLKFLVNSGYFDRDAKMILSYRERHSVAMYFQTNKLNNNNCLNISLRHLNTSECKIFAKKVLGQNAKVPDEIITQIAQNAQGNIAYIEQVLQYLFERRVFIIQNKVVQYQAQTDFSVPSNLEECFYKRLDFLKEQSEREYIFLTTASLLGDKPDYTILADVLEFEGDAFFETIAKLEKKGYLRCYENDIYGFKNSLTWSYCYIRAKEEELIKTQAEKLLEQLTSIISTTPLICPILAQIIGDKEFAYELWTQNLQYANYLGDINIYAMAQKQSLILLESVPLDNFEFTKNNICERLGKLIYNKNPIEAKDYLTNALLAAQKNDDINKIIDLSGYLVKSSYLTQDYNAVVEVVDNVLKYFDPEERNGSAGEKRSTIELQAALIKTRKLDALLKLGSWEEIATIVNTEINPVLQKQLNFFSKCKLISQNEIFYSWIDSNITLAQSYSVQGTSMAFELIDEIEKVLSKEKGEKIESLRVRLAYARAMANTSRGCFDESDNILQEILKNYSYVIDSPSLVCEWNIISIINKILRLDFETIKDDLFEATAYANNYNDELSKNILKTLLAYVFLEEKSYLKAIEISTNQMQYFSNQKIAFGALLAWYISAAATAGNKTDKYCIEICDKAVKICENARNNNFYFKILFQELLAKSYLKLNDLENARMYCDLASQSAMSNQLLYHELRLDYLRTQIYRESLASRPDSKKYDFAQNIIRMYTRALDCANRLNLKNYVKKIEKDLTSFRAHCQLNRIIEDK